MSAQHPDQLRGPRRPVDEARASSAASGCSTAPLSAARLATEATNDARAALSKGRPCCRLHASAASTSTRTFSALTPSRRRVARVFSAVSSQSAWESSSAHGSDARSRRRRHCCLEYQASETPCPGRQPRTPKILSATCRSARDPVVHFLSRGFTALFYGAPCVRRTPR
jgi:hypothetical protein